MYSLVPIRREFGIVRGLENCLKWGVLKKLLNSATFSIEKTRNE